MIKNYKLHKFNSKNIYPQGWIKHQLQVQLDGLTGHLHEFWPDIKDSAWIGGSADSWERVPYWLDGYIPLAFTLKDKKAIKVAEFYISNILKRQQSDGWIAPGDIESRKDYDVWGIFIILKALVGYADIKNDKKVYKAIYLALKALNDHIDKYPLYNWAKHRWYECLIPLYKVYKIYKEEWLIDLAKKLHDQGFDFITYYKNSLPTKKVKVGEWTYETHVVNNCMAVKAYALYSLMSKDKKDITVSNRMLEKLNKYHGAVTGAINGDENLSGLSPTQGSELCAIVELMYSLEILEQITGKSIYRNQLEKLAFNALPSALTNDMWAHQYDNQVNAPFIKRNDVHPWTTNGPESNLYGLEPNFGCCTANFHQGWIKFVESLVYFDSKGLIFNSYCPLKVKTRKYDFEVKSSYPFDYDVEIDINLNKEAEVRFIVPSFCEKFDINVDVKIKDGYASTRLEKGSHKIKITMTTTPKLVERKHGVSLIEGPIVYGLKVEQEKVRVNEDLPFREIPHADYEFHNKSSFAYRIVSDEILVRENFKISAESPYFSEKAPKSMYLKVEPIDYKIVGDYVILNKEKVTGNEEIKEFIPIAINKCHMGELPKRR